MDHHPTAVELEGLVVGGLSAEQRRTVIAHLVRGCTACGAVMAQYVPMLAGRTDRLATPPPPEDIYDGALSRAVEAVRRRGLVLPAVPAMAVAAAKTLEQKKQEAVDRLAERGLPGLADVPDFLLGVPLFEALLERSWTLRHEAPAAALELARCAMQVAEGLASGGREVADLRCRAAIELGNTYRVADELDSAEAALQRATSTRSSCRSESAVKTGSASPTDRPPASGWTGGCDASTRRKPGSRSASPSLARPRSAAVRGARSTANREIRRTRCGPRRGGPRTGDTVRNRPQRRRGPPSVQTRYP